MRTLLIERQVPPSEFSDPHALISAPVGGSFLLAAGWSFNNTENDCACPDRAYSLNIDCAASSMYLKTAGVYTEELPRGFLLAMSPFAPAGPSVLSPAAKAHWQEFSEPRSLYQPIDRFLTEQVLIHPDGAPPRFSHGRPVTLTAWLHITNACDLDCPYCYVRKSSARMSDEIGQQAIEAIFRTAQAGGFKNVKLKYAGGEATLHFKLIQRIHARARALAIATGLRLREVVLSNGVHLRPEHADWLIEQGVKLMVSVDGIGTLHDRLRPQRDGAPTFAQVEACIDRLLLPRGVRPDISMTVTGVNAAGAADVAHWAMIERALPTSFNFYRQNLLSAARSELALDERAIIAGMRAAYAVIEANLPEWPFFDGLLDRVQAEAHDHTCGVGQSYLVVTHTGQLAQCQMRLDSPVNANLDGDLLALVSAGPVRSVPADEKQGCRDCEFRYKCSGGCPLEAYRATGRWDIKSPSCGIIKALMPDALRLEGLRLLKVHGYIN